MEEIGISPDEKKLATGACSRVGKAWGWEPAFANSYLALIIVFLKIERS
jgi:hypothetical protein